MLCLLDHGIGALSEHFSETIVSYRGIVEGSILIGRGLRLRSFNEGAWCCNLSQGLLGRIDLSLFDRGGWSGNNTRSLRVLVVVMVALLSRYKEG